VRTEPNKNVCKFKMGLLLTVKFVNAILHAGEVKYLAKKTNALRIFAAFVD
jgi:hypothetical protein